MPTTLLLVDDERLSIERLLSQLESIGDTIDYEVVGVANNARDALLLIQEEKPDVIITDIRMPGMSGVELAIQLENLHFQGQLIFLTAYEEYALQAFDVHATDYLLKPVKTERLLKALVKAIEQKKGQSNVGAAHITAYKNHQKYALRIESIHVIHANWKQTLLYTKDSVYTCDTPLQKIEELYSWIFCRIHRSTLVNVTKIEKMVHDSNAGWNVIVLDCEEIWSVSRRLVSEVKHRLKIKT